MTAENRHTSRGLATRDRIVAATVSLIDERGVGGTSLHDVLTTARASKGQLYHYFDGREELVQTAVRAKADAVVSEQQELMDQLDDWDAISGWFDCLVKVQYDLEAHGGCPLASLTGALAEQDEVARRDLVAAFDRWEGIVARGLATMVERGLLRPDADPASLAQATMASVQGGLVLTQVRRDPQQLRNALDAAYAHLRQHAA